MLPARICLVVGAALGLGACADIPPPSPAPPLPPPPNAAILGSSVAPAPPAANKVAPPVVRVPAPIARPPQVAAPIERPPEVTALPVESLTLDLKALKQRLKETKSIGIFSKISLKNQVDDLLGKFRKYYQGKGKVDLTELRQSYNLLLMKVLSMLQDADASLSAAIVSSREAIWDLLSDPKKFATLDL